MGIGKKSAIALGVAALAFFAAGYTLLRAQPGSVSKSAVEVVPTRAIKLAAGAKQDQAPVFTPGGSATTSVQPDSAAVSSSAGDDSLVIKRILPIKGPIKYGEWHWDEANVPAGPTNITVDLDARVMSVWRGGYEIGAAAVLLGTPEKPTPTGTFPILAKYREHTSSIYDAPMPFTQRLTNGGISLHATTVERFYASHGCVGMPNEFARRVFETTKVGDIVIITRGKMAGKGDTLAAN
jgi:lipoprotein-anchoring transpeptidase ErfK/SrfK